VIESVDLERFWTIYVHPEDFAHSSSSGSIFVLDNLILERKVNARIGPIYFFCNVKNSTNIPKGHVGVCKSIRDFLLMDSFAPVMYVIPSPKLMKYLTLVGFPQPHIPRKIYLIL
jgi:hypothetical protein